MNSHSQITLTRLATILLLSRTYIRISISFINPDRLCCENISPTGVKIYHTLLRKYNKLLWRSTTSWFENLPQTVVRKPLIHPNIPNELQTGIGSRRHIQNEQISTQCRSQSTKRSNLLSRITKPLPFGSPVTRGSEAGLSRSPSNGPQLTRPITRNGMNILHWRGRTMIVPI